MIKLILILAIIKVSPPLLLSSSLLLLSPSSPLPPLLSLLLPQYKTKASHLID